MPRKTTRTILTTEYTFNEEEMKIIKQCIQYACHRLFSHDHCGLAKCVNADKLKELNRELNK